MNYNVLNTFIINTFVCGIIKLMKNKIIFTNEYVIIIAIITYGIILKMTDSLVLHLTILIININISFFSAIKEHVM